jgi:hypothetical protein
MVWAAWLVLLLTLAGSFCLRIWHPHFFPVTAMVVWLLVSGTLLVCRAAWLMTFGTQRRRSATWLLVGTAPLWFVAGHVAYGLESFYGRDVSLSYALRTLVPLGESLMDLEARIRYPVRTTGARVVMISPPVDDAAEQVAAMDTHVCQLERRIGRPLDKPVHWVRGPLFGIQGKAIIGLCMGSRPEESKWRGRQLDPLDRHEVAHCVINMICPPWAEPHALLVEGWAEANTGHDTTWLADRAWEYRERGQTFPIRELAGPAWAGRHELPVYVQGAPLVNYLLETYGPSKFFELYSASRRLSFPHDCRRILGVDLSEIETGYWTAVERLVISDGPPERRRLAGIALDPGTDPREWHAFLDEYFATLAARLAGYENCRQTIEVTNAWSDAQGKRRVYDWRCFFTRSGPLRSLVTESERRQMNYVAVAHPEHPFRATRESPDEPWKIRRPSDTGSDRLYRSMRNEIELAGFSDIAGLTSSAFQNRADWSSVALTSFEPFHEAGKRYLRLRFQDRTTSNQPPWRAVTFVLSVDESYAMRSCEYEDPRPDGAPLRTEVEYDFRDGSPVYRSLERTDRRSGRGLIESVWRVVQREYGASPAEDFTAERLLRGRVVEERPFSPFGRVPRPTMRWSRWLVVAGVVWLLAGLTGLRRKRTDRAQQSGSDREADRVR